MVVKDWFSTSILALLLLFYFYLQSVPINLATADLGRHIKNGELLLSGNFELLYKNFYSYTYPDFPFVNHHWLGGVVFYLIFILSGFLGIQLLFIAGNLISLYIFFTLAKKYSNIWIYSIAALLIIPVISYRDEVRPEVFSYLFAGIYYLVCRGFLDGWVKKKWLFALPFIQLIWVNTHIYFFVGFLIFGGFWLEGLVKWWITRDKIYLDKDKNITVAGFLSFLVSFINPHFYNGLIYPFQIYGNYGYRVLENQSVWFLEKIIPLPVLLYFKIVLGILVLSWGYKFFRLLKFKEPVSIANLIFSGVFSYLALTQIRNFALFGFFALPIVALNLRSLKIELSKYLLLPVLLVIFIFLLVINPTYWESRSLGLGLIPRVEKGAEFFVKENLKGPVFNNYDIGGYLIFFNFPREKVFVDNRPEAYPTDSFQKTYVPMQQSEDVWKQELAKYNFNAIFFYRQDLTDWSQRFLISRIKDPGWAPVFVDDYNIIFVKRNEQNSGVIKKYELPKEMFKSQ